MTITEILVNDEAVTSLAFGGEGDATRVEPDDRRRTREPFSAGEIAIGLTTMRDLGVGIGDMVSMRVDGVAREAEVVGRAVLPGVGLYQGSDRTSIGVGAIISPESLGPPTEERKAFVLVDLAPGADQSEFEQRMTESTQPVQRSHVPGGCSAFRHRWTGTVAFPAGGAVRRVGRTRRVHGPPCDGDRGAAPPTRRGDPPSARFDHGKVTAIGVWQGVTIGVAGLLLGVPLGVVAGRWLWTCWPTSSARSPNRSCRSAACSWLVVAVLTLGRARGIRSHPPRPASSSSGGVAKRVT